MTTTDTARRPLRYFQARIPVPDFAVREALDAAHAEIGGPRPVGVTARVLFTPDVTVYPCTGTPHIDIEELDFQVEFDDDEHPDDDTLDAWYDWESDIEPEHYMMQASDVVRRDGDGGFEIRFERVAFMGDYADVTDEHDDVADGVRAAIDAALDDARSNHLI